MSLRAANGRSPGSRTGKSTFDMTIVCDKLYQKYQAKPSGNHTTNNYTGRFLQVLQQTRMREVFILHILVSPASQSSCLLSGDPTRFEKCGEIHQEPA